MHATTKVQEAKTALSIFTAGPDMEYPRPGFKSIWQKERVGHKSSMARRLEILGSLRTVFTVIVFFVCLSTILTIFNTEVNREYKFKG